MMGRVAYGSMIVFAVACSSSAPEDITYPPLPDRSATEPGDASGDAKSAMLQAVDAGLVSEQEEESHEMPVVPSNDAGVAFPRDASIDAAIFADASMGAADAAPMNPGACDANEVEPNDVAPNELPYGRMCGAIVGQETDRFLFRPMQKTKLSFSSTSPYAVIYVGDYSGTFQQQVGAGQAISVDPSSDAWYAIAAGPKGASYVILAEIAP